MLKVLEEYRDLFPESGLQELCSLEGEVFKRIQNRLTFRVERGGRGFFLKCHRGVGWKEIFKNLFSLRLPVLGAGNEWRAIHRLHELGVETMLPVAYGMEGWNPAGFRSLLITEELRGCISLERYCENWRDQPPPVLNKRILIRRLAKIARTLHENGVNHRDFYICHFLIRLPWNGSETGLHLYLIDLHRVQCRNQTPRRWVVKDLGSLWFSVMELGLTRRDLLRFVREYRQRPLREILGEEGDFWRDVQRRADRLYRTRPGVNDSHG